MIFTGLAKLVCPVISFSVRAVKNLQCQTGTQVSCPMNPSQLSFCQTFYQKHQEIDEIKSHLKVYVDHQKDPLFRSTVD